MLIFGGKRTKEPSEPKEKSEPRKVAPARTSKPAPSKPSTKSMWDNFDLEKQYKKVKTAARDASEHDTTETWVDGKKVSVTKKKFYGDAAKEIASRLASSGKAVPHVGASKSLRKPSPNSVKPPVQAESFRRNLEKIREDHMEEGIIKDVIGGVKKLFKPKDPRDKNKTGGNSQVNSRDKYTDRSAKTSLAPIERARSGTMSTSAAQLTQRQGGVYTNMVESLKEMVDGQVPNIALNVGDSSITINNRIARKVINVYESLNKTNKKKLEKMLNEDANSFRKAINFIIKA